MQWSFFFMLVSSIVTEIKILLIDQILDHYMCYLAHKCCQFIDQLRMLQSIDPKERSSLVKTVAQLVKNFLCFMEKEISLPRSQQQSIEPYPKFVESSRYPHILLLKDQF
jgi:hypothetical protein